MNEKQRVFCRLVAVEGLSGTAAYAQVFGCKQASAATMAWRLLKRVEVIEEIKRLRERGREVAEVGGLWSKAVRQERLQRWADEAAEAGRFGEAVRCVDLLNKMDGAYEAEKVEVRTDEEWRAAVLGAAEGLRIHGN